MYVAIASYTLKPGKKAEFLSFYESLVPHLRQVPGFVTQYVVETDDEDTIMSFAIYETEAAATAPPPAALQEAMTPFPTFLAEGGSSERKLYPILTQTTSE